MKTVPRDFRHPIRRLRRDVSIVLHDIPSEAADGPDDPRVQQAARSITELYGLMAVGVLLWMIYLALALPERSMAMHYDVTWVGFDGFLVIAMGLTAWFAYQVDPRVELAANATATLLIVDAWMDTTTSSDNHALVTAILFAIFLELPLAYVSLRIARDVHRSIAGRARASVVPHGETEALESTPPAPPSGP
jgi:hypothetical protein